MRRPSIEVSADDLSFAEPSHYAVEEGLAVQSATCPAGQSCTGCFSGSVLAYMALLLFDNSSVVIFMMSLGISFGLLGSAVENPKDVKRDQFILYLIVCCCISSLLLVAVHWTEDLLSIIGVSTLTSTILNSIGFLLTVTDIKKTAATKPETYKSCV